MIRKQRIPKSREQRLRESEVHLYLLWEAYRLCPEKRVGNHAHLEHAEVIFAEIGAVQLLSRA
jgi:hypothetical protein